MVAETLLEDDIAKKFWKKNFLDQQTITITDFVDKLIAYLEEQREFVSPAMKDELPALLHSISITSEI